MGFSLSSLLAAFIVPKSLSAARYVLVCLASPNAAVPLPQPTSRTLWFRLRNNISVRKAACSCAFTSSASLFLRNRNILFPDLLFVLGVYPIDECSCTVPRADESIDVIKCSKQRIWIVSLHDGRIGGTEFVDEGRRP